MEPENREGEVYKYIPLTSIHTGNGIAIGEDIYCYSSQIPLSTSFHYFHYCSRDFLEGDILVNGLKKLVYDNNQKHFLLGNVNKRIESILLQPNFFK